MTTLRFLAIASWAATAVAVVDAVSYAENNRNFKKGLSMSTAESCNALENQMTSSWWYSWGQDAGFADSFCTDPASAETNARDAGMEFVPMFWNHVPAFENGRMVEDVAHANLQLSDYLLTFNEPDLEEQANLSPARAAQLWAKIEDIAQAYGVEIVAPCVTQDDGVDWYVQWLDECNNLYERDCYFDYTCIHMYYQPYTEDPTERCDFSDYEWACIQQGGEQGPTRAEYKLNQWAGNYPGKPIWVTEYACAPWGSSNGCSPEEHRLIMEQLTPLLESHDDVYRYAWFGLYGGEGEGGSWEENGLVENVWTFHAGKGCEGQHWLGGFGSAGWQIQTMQECLAKAETSDGGKWCQTEPMALAMDDDNCYCAKNTTDSCALESTWGAMTTWIESGASRDSGALTAMGELYETYGMPESDEPSAAPSQSPSKSPSQTPTENDCVDAPGDEWTFRGKENKDCAWIANKPAKKHKRWCGRRANKPKSDKTRIWAYCGALCLAAEHPRACQ